jgi:hypothetical protein
MAELTRNQRQAAHEGAADTENVNVHAELSCALRNAVGENYGLNINPAINIVGLITNTGCVSCGFSREIQIHQEDVFGCRVNGTTGTRRISVVGGGSRGVDKFQCHAIGIDSGDEHLHHGCLFAGKSLHLHFDDVTHIRQANVVA